MAKVLQNPEVKEKFRTLGMDAVWSTPDELGRQIKTDLAKWTQVMAQEGIKAE